MTRTNISASELLAEWQKKPEFKKAYDGVEEEFALASTLIEARSRGPEMSQRDE